MMQVLPETCHVHYISDIRLFFIIKLKLKISFSFFFLNILYRKTLEFTVTSYFIESH
jgi:hypothetical protein